MKLGPTFVDVLRERAAASPERTAVRFLDSPSERREMSYRELDAAARAIAARLRETSSPGERAVLLFAPGPEYVAAFFGCLYAGVTAVPAYPPMNERQVPRLATIMADAEPAFVLGTESTLEWIQGLAGGVGGIPVGAVARWIATDALAASAGDGWAPPDLTGDTTAFLQYTSGTTGRPKGVIVSHRNLLNNSTLIQRRFGHDSDSRGVIWLPPYHDMGLIGGILQPIYVGFPVTLMSPTTFLRDPALWLDAIAEFSATTSGGPNFAFDLCVRKIPAERRARIDLSSWRVAFVGSETVREETLRAFADAFHDSGFRLESFYPCYGLAEATLMVTGGLPDRPPVVRSFDGEALTRGHAQASDSPGARSLVGCGRAGEDHLVTIVDPATRHARADGEIGEIWVRGPSVTDGYWRVSDPTPEHVGVLSSPGAAVPYLRTGDLGFRCDGELFVTGRMKDVVVIRGRNHAPDAIELTVAGAHPLLRPGCTAAFSVDDQSGGRLVVAQELSRATDLLPDDVAEIVRAVRTAVTQAHGLAVHTVALLRPGTVPKTSSGKVQRSQCRSELLAGGLRPLVVDALTAPAAAGSAEGSDERARTGAVQAAAARVLGVAVEQLPADRPLTDLGLDSVKAVEIGAVLEQDGGWRVPLERLLAGSTPAELAACLERPAPAPGEPADDGALTGNERAMWFLQHLAPDSRAYHLCHAVDIRGHIDIPDLRRALEAVSRRHPALRTRFEAVQGEPRRVVGPPSFQVDSVEAAGWGAERIDEEITAFSAAPIDLPNGPLWRIKHWAVAADRHVLALATHHIVADLWSLAIVARELVAHLAGESLPPRRDGAPDMRLIAGRERAYLAADNKSGPPAQRWLDRLADAPAATDLATDLPRPAVQTFRGAAHRFSFADATARALGERAREWSVTRYAVLLASFSWLLRRYTGADDLVVGAPAPGRTDPASRDVVGMLVNTVPVRCQVPYDQTFRSAVAGVSAAVRDCLADQRLPFATLVEQLRPHRDPSRTPVFQVVLALQQTSGHDDLAVFGLGYGELSVGSLRATARYVRPTSAPFDLTVQAVEHGGGLHAEIRYNADLWEPRTIEGLAEHWQTLLSRACAAPDQPADEGALLGPTDRHRLLTEFNAVRGPVSTRPLHAGLTDWAGRTPDAPALTDGTTRLSYHELESAVRAQTGALARAGVSTESRVGLLIGRGASFVVAALSVLSRGGAFVPLEPDQPVARLARMVRDGALSPILTAGASSHVDALAAELGAASPPFVPIGADTVDATVAEEVTILPANAAYVMHTSGTTGAPKGVCCTHAGVRNLLDDFDARAPIQPGDACAWWTGTGFDVAVYEIFAAIDAGAHLMIVPERVRLEPTLLADWFADERVAAGYVPPFAVDAMTARAERGAAGGAPLPLRRLMVGVEPLPRRTLARLAAAARGLAVLNSYGPTETAIIATTFEVDPADPATGTTPLGRPVCNGPVYVLDERRQLVPIGVPGELHIGGAGVARGYHGRPAATAERFVPDPWVPGGRMYRTGDIVRYDRDGQLRFLGRRDSQVKLRGIRIELREVESALLLDERVESAVAVVRDVGGEPVLVGYVVARDGAPRPEELLARARLALPPSMVPATVVCLPAWPLTRNGKLDRAALPPPHPDPDGYEEPRGELELSIAAVWSEVLRGPVGRTDDFFGLGGHSLLAARAALELGNRLDREVPVAALFTHPTVATLAEALSDQTPLDLPMAALPRPGGDWTALRDKVLALPDYAVAALIGDQIGEPT